MKYSIKITLLLYLTILIVGCGANRKNLPGYQFTHRDQIPPGVDTLLAYRADSLANLFFVDYAQKLKSKNYCNQSRKLFVISDSLWQLYQNILDTTISNTIEDSVLVANFYQKCRRYLKPQAKKSHKEKLIFPNIKQIKSLALALCRKSKNYIDNAKLTNPYDLNVRINLIQVLIQLGKLSNDKHFYKLAVNELKNFLIYEKSQDDIYSLLAECYHALSDWENAYKNFYQAEKVLERVAYFQYHDSQFVELDTVRLVYYLQQQGDSKAKTYDDKSALQLLEKAQQLTSSPQKMKQIQNYIDWINWDDGNILAVEKRDDSYKLYRQKKYKKANKESKKLLKILKTQRTKNQINWKIATIDFKILNKKDNGIRRLFKVIKNIPPNKLTDSSSVVYLEDYGAMCYSRGMDYLEEKKYKIAYAYFKQATKVNWHGQGESYFQLAQLSQSDANEIIKNCQQVLIYEDRLSPKLLSKTYELLVNAYKRNGNFKLAREYYHKLNSDLSLTTF